MKNGIDFNQDEKIDYTKFFIVEQKDGKLIMPPDGKCEFIRRLEISRDVQDIEPLFGGLFPSLDTILVEPGNLKYDSRIGCNAIIETKTNKLVFGCNTTVIPRDVKVIGERAFLNAIHFRRDNFVIPDSVTEISGLAFARCDGLHSLIFSKNPPQIDSCAFSYCYNLKKSDFPFLDEKQFDSIVDKYYEWILRGIRTQK